MSYETNMPLNEKVLLMEEIQHHPGMYKTL